MLHARIAATRFQHAVAGRSPLRPWRSWRVSARVSWGGGVELTESIDA